MTSSTIPEEVPGRWDRWERRFHVVSIGVVVLIVALAAFGIFGVRTGAVVATGNGLSLEVLHSQVTRPGLATPWSATVSTEDGSPLPGNLTLMVSTPYLAIFDLNGLSPAPSAEFSNEQWTWWEFEIPPGQGSIRIDLDVRLEPAVQWARFGSAAVEVNGVKLVSADFQTWVMP